MWELLNILLIAGGGVTEAAKAAELTQQLRIPVHPSQVGLANLLNISLYAFATSPFF